MKKKFIDSAEMPIIAFDFDGTINIEGEHLYPECGIPRRYAREVLNFLHYMDIKVVLWTSRDASYNQEDMKMYDHVTPMVNFMKNNAIKYHAINRSVQFAPYHYNGRKVYAHMYVDDRNFGWHDSESIMIDILDSILDQIVGLDKMDRNKCIEAVMHCEPYDRSEFIKIKEKIKNWRNN